jgi:hypothetical protein
VSRAFHVFLAFEFFLMNSHPRDQEIKKVRGGAVVRLAYHFAARSLSTGKTFTDYSEKVSENKEQEHGEEFLRPRLVYCSQ